MTQQMKVNAIKLEMLYELVNENLKMKFLKKIFTYDLSVNS